MKIALLGAECTGKSTLATALVAHVNSGSTTGLFNADTHPAQPKATLVKEALRTWCDQMGRTPLAHEQAGIARLQEQAILAAASGMTNGDVLVADTTPLMTAIYSRHYFHDNSLLPGALAVQQQFDHTLLMGLDLPWHADGLQRDGPATRQAIDTLLRATLNEAGLPYRVILGQGQSRLQQAMTVLSYAPPSAPVLCAEHARNGMGDMHLCAQCGNAWAERQLFSRLLSRSGSNP